MSSSLAVAHLAMYPFPQLTGAWQALWADVRGALGWGPPTLCWPDEELHASWLDPSMLLGHTCGWPLVTELSGRVRTVGAFVPQLPETFADPLGRPRYRTVLVSHDPAMTVGRAHSAAVNSPASLSGWISLRASGWTADRQVTWTGAHVESLGIVARGEADVASIDSVSYHLLARVQPSMLEGVHAIGVGPLMPMTPLVTSLRTSDTQLAELRQALQSVGARPELLIDSFQPCEFDDYWSILGTFVQGMDDA